MSRDLASKRKAGTAAASRTVRGNFSEARYQWVKANPTVGSWTILGVGTIDSKKQAHIRCRCKCGFEKEIAWHILKAGKSKRCKACDNASRKK